MDKKEYRVTVREVHHQDFLIKATSADEARKLVYHGDGDIDEGSFVYSHSLDPETWTIEEE